MKLQTKKGDRLPAKSNAASKVEDTYAITHMLPASHRVSFPDGAAKFETTKLSDHSSSKELVILLIYRPRSFVLTIPDLS